jgi:hypothetical protein
MAKKKQKEMTIGRAIELTQTRIDDNLKRQGISKEDLVDNIVEVGLRLSTQCEVIALRMKGFTNVDIAKEMTKHGTKIDSDAISKWLNAKTTATLEHRIALENLYMNPPRKRRTKRARSKKGKSRT